MMRPSKSKLFSSRGCLRSAAYLALLGYLALLPAHAVFAAEADPAYILVSGHLVPLPLRVQPTAPTLDPEARAQALAQRTTYEETIARLGAQQGVYGIELSEAYMGLGTILRALDLPEEAAEAFGKALQSLRISQGLNDMRQLPVLEELRATNETLENWDEVDATTHLIFHVAKHNAETTEEVRVQTLLQLGRWMRRAYAEDLVSNFDANAGDVADLYNNEISRLEGLAPYDGRNLHLASLYLDLAATELMEAKRKYEMPISEFQTPGAGEQRTTMQQTCFSVVDRSGRTVQTCTTPMEVPNINYYLAPNMQKSTEIRTHLAEVENKVMAAFNTLQELPAPDEAQTALLSEVHRLTSEYNDFVAINRSK